MTQSESQPSATSSNPPAPAPAGPSRIAFNDFVRLDIRVATVTSCIIHPRADKLLILQIDLGTEKRQICAGLRQWYQPEQLVGKQIIVVVNLEPRSMRGELSDGMLLAATDPATGRVVVLTPAEPVAPGSRVS